MSYTKTNWVDSVLSNGNYYIKSNPDGTFTITPAGTVVRKGTEMSARNFNNMEEGIYSLDINKADKSDVYSKPETDSLLRGKVDKDDGKGLSDNNYSDEEKTKLAGLENYDDTQIKNNIALSRTTLGTQCKNLFKNTAVSQTAYGVTFTVNDDKSITVNGTATQNIYLNMGSFYFEAGKQYILTGCPSGGSRTKYFLSYDGMAGHQYDTGSGTIFSVNESVTKTMLLVIISGQTVSNLTFKPMLRYADITDDTYEPYKESVDERLINNTSDIAISRTTIGYQCKNLLKIVPRTITSGGVTCVIDDNGIVTVNGTASETVFINIRSNISLDETLEYTLTGTYYNSSYGYIYYQLGETTGGNNRYNDFGNGVTFKGAYGSVSLRIPVGAVLNNVKYYPMLRYADITDSTYEPYKPSLQEQIDSKVTSKILYSSDTGARSVTLSEAPSNYDYLMIYISGIGAGTQCISIPGSGTFHNAIITGSPTPTQSNTPYFIGILATLSDTNKTVALTYGKKVSVSSSGNTLEDISNTTGYITRVTGFKSN